MANTAHSTTLSSKTRKVTDLSFVKASDGTKPHMFWNVQSTGDHELDEDLGAKLVLEYLEYEAQRDDSYPILPHILSDMPRPYTAIEITFIGLIGFAAIDGRYEAKRIASYWAEMSAKRAA